MKKSKNPDVIDSERGIIKYRCRVCGRQYKTPERLEAHLWRYGTHS